MNSKITCTLLLVLFAMCSAPVCSRAQSQTVANRAPSGSSDFNDTIMHPAMNGIYAEALGSGLVYTLNYERWLSSSFALRLGFGYLPVSAEKKNGTTASESATDAPLTLSWFPFDASSSKLEIGAGFSYIDLTKPVRGFPEGSNIGYAGIVGYRYEEPDGGFLFRIDFTPVMLAGTLYPWGGVSLGYGF